MQYIADVAISFVLGVINTGQAKNHMPFRVTCIDDDIKMEKICEEIDVECLLQPRSFKEICGFIAKCQIDDISDEDLDTYVIKLTNNTGALYESYRVFPCASKVGFKRAREE